ncbi:fibronectin type III domain-containing protein [Flavobacterium sp. N2038]|uniref:fibronectin type III domain-containing protein n=1 Tax=Flavobacterium sp. N2038 TaxID=2986829 RepID=UPI0022247581|nr:fibronectin type III domain-containing protein [Flavobacterium sp. N2038]
MIKKIHLYLLLLCSFLGSGAYAQTYPVRITTQLIQPSPIYLSSYADATTINSPIKIQLVLNDLTISNRQVRLKIYFQGNGIAFNTNDFVVGAKPLYLEGGFPLQLTNVDLAPYFEYQNLLGINPNQYAQPLPEGIYNIYVEVYDFATNKKLSSKTGTTTIIFQNEPPFLNLPLNNASIMQQNIQNIVFGWTPRSINVSNVEYEFSLVEIWDKYTPVQNAFAYSPPLYTTTTRTTSLQYGINEPQLIPGRRYAWRVKAKALLGAEEIGVFKNNGYSEIFSFDYEVYCTAPLGIKTDGISENQAKVSWSGNIDNFDYQVKYREKNSGSEWYSLVTPRENITISNLKANTTYEYTVGSSCDVGKYTHSTIKEFTTLVRDEIAFQGCGIKPDPKDLANKTPLKDLFPNDVVTAGDFPIVVLHSTGSNGTFSGDGYVTLPFLEKFRKLIDAADALAGENEKGESKGKIGENTRIRITFNNIGINTDFKLISGEIIASYDPNWSSMADLDGVFNDVFGSDGKPIEVKVNYEVKSAVLNPDGSTTITGTDGQITNVPKSAYNQVYTDNKGTTVTIPANGKGEPIITAAAPGGKATAANTNGVSSSGEVTQIYTSNAKITFKNSTDSKYAFDAKPGSGSQKLLDTYEKIPTSDGSTYNVNYKAVSNLKGPETFIATAIFKNGKTKDDIVFKTNTGTIVDANWKNDTEAEITVEQTLAFSKESIIATVKGVTKKDPDNATKTIEGKAEIAGKLNVWQLEKKPVISVTILSVNKASVPKASVMQDSLNSIYNKAGVEFKVSSQNVDINPLPNIIDCGDSNIVNVYTNAQNDIKNQIEASSTFTYNDETYYVIYTGKLGSNGYNGFMPLGGQYAFVFDNKLRTAAHELGHGIFGLKHPFTTDADKGKTNLLMDYGTGTVLSHNDWDIIHSGGWKFYGFQKSSSGGHVSSELSSLPARYKNNNNTYSFLTPSGIIITLPSTTKKVTFSTLDPFKYKFDGKNSGDYAPLGSLISFTTSTNNRYAYKGGNNEFVYECEECKENKQYNDQLSSALGKNLSKTIVAIPYYENSNIYLHFIVYPKKSDQNFNTNNINYGNPLNTFSIIEELNNSENLNQNYFDLIKDDDYFSNEITSSALSEFSIDFLEKYNTIASKYSPLSPLVVSSGFLFSEFDSSESNITCNINTIQEELDKIFQKIEEATKTKSRSVAITAYLRALSSDLIIKQLGQKYDLFRNGLQNTKDNKETTRKINSEIASSNTANQMAEIINKYDNCNLELINFENRIKAINLLEKTNNEEEIIKLINTVAYNSQTPQLLQKLFENKSKLFIKLWNRLDFSEFHLYINKITEYVKISDTSTPKENFSFSLNQNNNSGTDFNFIFNPDGTLKVELKRLPIYSSYVLAANAGFLAVPIEGINETIKTWNFTNLNQIVSITIPANGTFLEWENNQKTDVNIDVPAYYIAYLIHNKHLKQGMLAARVLGNLVAIVTSIPSGGQSLTAMEALTIVLSSSDLIIALNEDKIKELNGGTTFIEAWDTIMLVDGGIALTRLGISVIKSSAGKILKISFDLEKFKNALKTLSIEDSKIIKQLKEISPLLKRMGQETSQVIFNNKLLSYIEQSILKTKFTSMNKSILDFENWIIGKIGTTKVFEIDFATSGGFVKFTNIKSSLVKANDEVIGTLTEIRYADETGKIQEGSFNIMKSGDSVYVIKIANETNDFIRKISGTPLLAKFNSLSDEFKSLLMHDFGDASTDLFKELSKKDSELFTGWKKFRTNNPKEILCTN